MYIESTYTVTCSFIRPFMLNKDRVLDFVRNMPEKKRYFEFITAALSVPVLLTVLVTNLSNMNKNKDVAAAKAETKATAPSTIPIEIRISPVSNVVLSANDISEKDEGGSKPTEAPTATPNPSQSPTPTHTPTPTPTTGPTSTPAPSATLTPTVAPSLTITPTVAQGASIQSGTTPSPTP